MKVKIVDSLGNSKDFKTKADAAKFLKVNESSIRKAIKKGYACKGYKVYINEDVIASFDSFNKAIEEYIHKKPVSRTIPNGRHLCISDLHIPYVDQELMLKLVRMIKDNKFVGLHILGDYLDLSSLSKYDLLKLNKGVTLAEEYIIGNFWLDVLCEYLDKDAYKSYIAGNHELRFNKYMQNSEAAKLGKALISTKDGLQLKNRGFIVVEDYPDGYIQLGDIQLIHGIYLNSNHPKTHIQKLRSSCMYGHTHQQLTYSENGLTAYNIGFLANKTAPIFSYSNRFEKANWKEGFAVINYHDGKTFVEVVECKNGSFYYNGVLY